MSRVGPAGQMKYRANDEPESCKLDLRSILGLSCLVAVAIGTAAYVETQCVILKSGISQCSFKANKPLLYDADTDTDVSYVCYTEQDEAYVVTKEKCMLKKDTKTGCGRGVTTSGKVWCPVSFPDRIETCKELLARGKSNTCSGADMEVPGTSGALSRPLYDIPQLQEAIDYPMTSQALANYKSFSVDFLLGFLQKNCDAIRDDVKLSEFLPQRGLVTPTYLSPNCSSANICVSSDIQFLNNVESQLNASALTSQSMDCVAKSLLAARVISRNPASAIHQQISRNVSTYQENPSDPLVNCSISDLYPERYLTAAKKALSTATVVSASLAGDFQRLYQLRLPSELISFAAWTYSVPLPPASIAVRKSACTVNRALMYSVSYSTNPTMNSANGGPALVSVSPSSGYSVVPLMGWVNFDLTLLLDSNSR